MMDTVERARGRWKEILPQLGIETRFLQNKHMSCPLCGGKDRFRFDDRYGDGWYHCNQCGAGPGIILVRKLHGWDHPTACQEVDRIIGTDRCTEPVPAKQVDDPDRKRRAVEKVINGAGDEQIVERYLLGRGLAARSSVLLGHRTVWHSAAKRFFPAVIAPITGPDGILQSVQRIFVGEAVPDDARKTIMPPVDTIKAAAVRLFDVEHELGIAEGVETALAAHEIFRRPVWAALTAGNLEAFEPPATVRHIYIYGDNDTSFTGQTAAYALAKRLVRTGISIDVEIPDRPDTDWLDWLLEHKGCTDE